MRRFFLMVMSVALLAGCEKKNEAKPAVAPPTAGDPAKPMGMGAMGMPAAAAAGPGLKGKILEKVDAASYSYLRLQTEGGETWAAVPQTDKAVGAEVEVVGGMPMDGFESKTLNKKFDKILFGQLGGAAGAPAAPMGMGAGGPTPNPAAGAQMPPGHPPMGAAGDVGDVKTDKATGENAKTVAEIWAQKDKLKDAKVVVKGKVVKSSNGIMGKNWVHLRDGSGTDAAKDNDITITTADTVGVGDVVTAEGVVHLDKDFGAGYSYKVIVEEASLKK